MSKEKNVAILIQPVPAALKEAITAEAEERGTSLNDVAVSILAEEFRIRYEVTARKSSLPRQKPNDSILYLTVPLALKVRLNGRATAHQASMSAVARSILLRHYGIGVETVVA